MTGDGRRERGVIELRFDTSVAAPMAAVWAQVSTFAGINAELAPLVKMTFPAALRADGFDTSTGLDQIVVASQAPSPRVPAPTESPDGSDTGTTTRPVRCWLLAAGFVPIDRHSFDVERVVDEPDMKGFDEQSTSWLQRRWRHERRVTVVSEMTCRVTDRLTVVPRLALLTPLVAPIVRSVFRHRHRRLVSEFGTNVVNAGE